jgi:hypothetical protein
MNSKAKHGKDHRFSQAADTSIAIAIAKNTEGNLLASIYIYIYIEKRISGNCSNINYCLYFY